MYNTDNKYQRQILLEGFGEGAQKKLQNARVLVIGAGGLGCPALLYLAAAGVGTIGIIDDDVVSLNNLHRQVLYAETDVGKLKVEIAVNKLAALNSDINLKAINLKIDNTNALEIISGYDIVMDGSDNFTTRYLVNDACVLLKKPLIYGAIYKYEGQAGVFNAPEMHGAEPANYRDVFPVPLNNAAGFSCRETGVLGVLPGIIGTMQATEAIKIITGVGRPLYNKIVTYNILNNTFYDVIISTNEANRKSMPRDESSFKKFDYILFCNLPTADEITREEFQSLLSENDVTVIDVREHDETPEAKELNAEKIPLSQLSNRLHLLNPRRTIVVFCQMGIRSRKAVRMLQEHFTEKRILNLKGGITEWINKRNHGQ